MTGIRRPHLAALLALTVVAAPALSEAAVIRWTLTPVVVPEAVPILIPDGDRPLEAPDEAPSSVTVSGSFDAALGGATISNLSLTVTGPDYAGSYTVPFLPPGAPLPALGGFAPGTDTGADLAGQPVVGILGAESLFGTAGLSANLLALSVGTCPDTTCERFDETEPVFATQFETPSDALTGEVLGEIPLPAGLPLLLTGLGALALLRRRA